MPAAEARTAVSQGDLFSAAPAWPEGFRYQPDLIDPAEEAVLANRLAELTFTPFDFHGHEANRKIVGYGLRYDYAARKVMPTEPIPDWLMPLRAKTAAFTERPADRFVQVLINEYEPGAGIGWHRDKPQFDEVIGVSLLTGCNMRFRRAAGAGWDRLAVPLAPRSAYLLSGPARSVWEHSILPLPEHRYSITFRSLTR